MTLYHPTVFNGFVVNGIGIMEINGCRHVNDKDSDRIEHGIGTRTQCLLASPASELQLLLRQASLPRPQDKWRGRWPLT